MSDSVVTALLIVANTLIVVLGTTITYLATRAVRRTGSSALQSLALGFGFLTLGGIIAGFLNQFMGVGLRRAFLLQSLLTALGLAVLTKSLYLDGLSTTA